MNTCLLQNQKKEEQKDENEKQLQFHFPEAATFNTFLKTMHREDKMLLHVVSRKPA